jgi:putative sigma-54 modulation protein
MQINYTGQNIEITTAIRNVIEKKFNRIQRHFDKDILSVNIVLSIENLLHIVESTLHIAGATIFAKGESDTIYKAIDDMLAKLEKQVQKRKEKTRGY